MPPEELQSMKEFVGHVKKDVAGLAIIHEVDVHVNYDELPPPPPELLLQDLNDNEEPIYVNVERRRGEPLLPPKDQHHSAHKAGNVDNLYHARPYHVDSKENLSNLITAFDGRGGGGCNFDSFDSTSSDLSNPTSQAHIKEHISTTDSSRAPKSKINQDSLGHHGAKTGDGRSLLEEAIENPTIPAGKKCESCKSVLKTGDVAISAERAGPSKVWHPACFKCCECKVSKTEK